MFSRLSALAAAFAVVATASLAVAATVQQPPQQRAVSAPAPVVQLPRVEVVGRRDAR